MIDRYLTAVLGGQINWIVFVSVEPPHPPHPRHIYYPHGFLDHESRPNTSACTFQPRQPSTIPAESHQASGVVCSLLSWFNSSSRPSPLPAHIWIIAALPIDTCILVLWRQASFLELGMEYEVQVFADVVNPTPTQLAAYPPAIQQSKEGSRSAFYAYTSEKG
jgi:hypothetical protein